MKKVVARSTTTKNNYISLHSGTQKGRNAKKTVKSGVAWYDNEWGFSNKMLDLTRHIDSVRKA